MTRIEEIELEIDRWITPLANAEFSNKDGAYQGPRFVEGATPKQVIRYLNKHSAVVEQKRIGSNVELGLHFPGYKQIPGVPAEKQPKPKIMTTVTSAVHTDDGDQVVISGQFGCAFDCVGCLVNKKGINQAPEQIYGQVHNATRRAGIKPSDEFVIFATGEGDDGANAENIIIAIPHLHKSFPGLKMIRVSTAGATSGIEQFTKAKLPVKVELQISLHATVDEYRRQFALKPENMTIAKLLKAGKNYYDAASIPVRLNYLTFARNLTDESAQFLANLDHKAFYVALVEHNETGIDMPAWGKVHVTPAEIEDFQRRIASYNKDMNVVMEPDWAAILLQSGCGQVAGQELAATASTSSPAAIR